MSQPFPPLPQALETLVKLNEEQFKVLRESVSSPLAFDRSLSRCDQLAQQLKPGPDTREVWSLLIALRFLYDQCQQWRDQGRDITNALWEFIDFTGFTTKLGETKAAPGFQRLLALISTNPAVEERRKLRWLRRGILPNAIGFSSFVDVRPNFSADRSSIGQLIPMIIFRVELDTSADDDTVFQLTPEALSLLKRAVDDIEKKLAALKIDKSFADRLLTSSVRDQDDEEDS